MLKGATTEFLAERAATLIPGDHALVHAAAGGVGQLLVQWLTANGVNVIATASSNAKLAIARQCGATHASDARPRPGRQGPRRHRRRGRARDL
jgi:NADPH2:quinone reductase